MMKLLMKFRSFKFLIINLILFYPFVGLQQIYSSSILNKPSSEYLKNIPKSNFYIIGPGDVISIEVNDDTPELNINFSIDGEGTAKLKRLDRVYVSGLTIGELSDILNKEYERFVKEPDVTLRIVKYRPVKVYIEGEVESPGLQVLEGSSSPLVTIENFGFENNSVDLNTSNFVPKSNLDDNVYFPSLFDVIRKSQGISVYADLENIEITRINNISNGGGRLKTTLNLLDTIKLKDISQNIRVLDGDTVRIPKVDKPITQQLSMAMKVNINPKFIKVGLTGGIENPGQITLNKGASLNDALTFAGGLKPLRGKLVFVRYQNDGLLDRRKFNYSKSAKAGSYKNPYLRNGDFIVVTKGALTKSNEVISEITSPLQGIITSYGFYKLLVQ